jgi:general secretion pathway protein A
MYESFFSLTKAPFSLVPDPDCIHLTAQHADAISGLAFGILERKGYLALTAEAGLGKTTALRALSQLLAESNAESSVIFAPTLTGPEFLEMAMLNFGFRDVPQSKAQRLKMLEHLLLRSDAEGRVMALIVDEAHQLSPELLEEVRLLGNFETSDRKLLQIVLVGQNQLNDQLNLPQLWQLKQRIAVRLSLRRLDRQAVEEYIRFRWGKAGGQEPTPFSAAAFHAISTWSGGNPRLINVICENALLIAFSETSRGVDVQTVRDACEELYLPTPTIARSSPSFAGARPLMGPSDQSLLEPAREPGELTEPEGAQDSWAMWRPSLLKRLMGRSAAQERARTRSRTGILSLNEP